MSKLKIKAFSFLFYSLLTCLITYILYTYGSDITLSLSQIQWPTFFLLVCLQIPCIALGGLAFQLIVSLFNLRLRWQEWVGLSFIANLLNQLLPYRPGIIFRYFYLRLHYQIKATEFAYAMLIYFILTLVISAGFTLAGWIDGGLPPLFINFNLLALMVIIVFFTLACWVKVNAKRSFKLPAARRFSVLVSIIHRPAILFGALTVFILLSAITTLIFYMTFSALHSPLPVHHCLFLVGVVTIAMIFPITPGNIGVLEALIGSLTQAMYNDFSLGFSVTALYRATQWVPSIIFGTFFSFILAGSLIPRLKI